MYNEDFIKGALAVLDILYWKVSVEECSKILVEASQIPDLHGNFIMDKEKDKVKFIPDRSYNNVRQY